MEKGDYFEQLVQQELKIEAQLACLRQETAREQKRMQRQKLRHLLVTAVFLAMLALMSASMFLYLEKMVYPHEQIGRAANAEENTGNEFISQDLRKI